jgi:pimeloyl-ACP methyl ester carboxylesterase
MTRGTVAAVAGALLAVAFGAYVRWHAADSAGSPAATHARLPVLMIHGSGMNSSVWTPLVRHLQSHGWPEEYLLAVDLVPDNGANIAAAERQLVPAAQALLERAAGRAAREGRDPPGKLAVVGHSMGAVSGRWLAARLIPERVAVFVAIAGVNHGSSMLCGRTGEGDRELCRTPSRADRSAVLEQLNGTEGAPADETPYGPARDPPGVTRQPPAAAACIAWYAVLIDPDEWVVPAASAHLAGSGGRGLDALPAGIERWREGEFVLRTPARHDDLPATPAVMELVASLLLEPAAACPE